MLDGSPESIQKKNIFDKYDRNQISVGIDWRRKIQKKNQTADEALSITALFGSKPSSLNLRDKSKNRGTKSLKEYRFIRINSAEKFIAGFSRNQRNGLAYRQMAVDVFKQSAEED